MHRVNGKGHFLRDLPLGIPREQAVQRLPEGGGQALA